MVQKEAVRRGRPRAYDPDTALTKALETFWKGGYAATSLDDLCAAMGMNRPSLYAAFGDKHALYTQALAAYRERARVAMQEALPFDQPIAAALRGLYGRALALYFSDPVHPRGCFLIGTALTEAVQDPEIRDALNDSLRSIDAAFERRFQAAVEQGELPAGAEPAVLAHLAAAVLHTLAIRSRAGEARDVLERIADAGVKQICG